MKIGLISDTHDRLPTLRSALRVFDQASVQTLLHAGDLIAPFAAQALAAHPATLHVVYGNNDGERVGLRRVLPGIQDGPLRLELAGRRILLHHFADWCRPDQIEQAEFIITGHTHRHGVETRAGRCFVNPGECCGWVTGTAHVALLDLASGEVEFIEVRE